MEKERTPSKAGALSNDDEDDDFQKLLKSGHNLESMIPTDLSGKDKVQYADDAMDFESEDELADEEDVDVDAGPSAAGASPGSASADGRAADEADVGADENWTQELGFFDDIGVVADEVPAYDPEAQQQAERARQMLEEEERELAIAQLKEWYPGFEPHTVLRMNKLFGPEPSKMQLPQSKAVRALVPTRMRVEVETEQADAFVDDTVFAAPSGLVRIIDISRQSIEKAEMDVDRAGSAALSSVHGQPRSAGAEKRAASGPLPLDVADWDDVLDAGSSSDSESGAGGDSAVPAPRTPSPQLPLRVADMAIIEGDVYGSDDEEAILNGEPASKRAKLDMNDPRLLFVEDRRTALALGRRNDEEPQVNISNDRAYDMLRENYQSKVRSTIGSLNIDHSMVALRLQSPFYKVRLPKQQLRSWHRPKFVAKAGTQFQISSLKMRKKRKDKNRSPMELLAKSSDLTLGDSAPFFMVEYSEENPIVLSGTGMGSKLINYYRKKSPEDTSRPKLPQGETHVLDVQDRSAFWNFGFIEPGNVVPTLYNQMIRAPVFQHKPLPTDFLLIKSSSHARGTKFFLRPLPFIFTAGQALPATQIPGPHSRKVTTASKNRLKMVVYRVLNKDPNHRLQVRDISSHFPDQNDMQNRQRLKEFMEYQRSGEDQGYWKVKPGEALPAEDEIRSMVTPEDIMLLESMQVGQQQLEDSGYSKTVDDDDNNGDADGLSFEEQLAPWNISRNFINAIQGKAMLQLNGAGDPTARGEGFSLLRTSMKGGFATDISAEDEKKLGGHSYNVALQQKAYDEEIKRIWYAQSRALKVDDPKKLPDMDRLPETMVSAAATPSASNAGKVLQITRTVRDENGVLVRETELVTDPQVIRAYMKRRKAMETAKLAVDQIAVSEDMEENKARRKFLEQELARLNRNADRRQARKATKQDAKLKATTRKCATCGAVGHIKTNKSCPLYNDIYLNASKAK